MRSDLNIEILERTKGLLLRVFEKYKIVFLAIFVFVVCRHSYHAIKLGTDGSWDMQWYPAIQYWGLGKFAHAINPYLAYLDGDVFMAQGPNYAPLLYVLMYPFALMDFASAKAAFAIFSVMCFLGSLWLFYKHKTNLAFLVLMVIFLLYGYTFYNVIQNGQSTIILGFFLTLGYIYRKNPIILTLCLSVLFVKYSFGIPVLLGFFLAGYYKESILAGLINLAFVILFAFQFDITILQSLLLPLKVSAQATGVGPSDLMSLSRVFFEGKLFLFYNPFLWGIVLVYCAYVYLCFRLSPPPARIIASSILLSLCTFYHLGYDQYMFLIAIFIAKDSLKMTKTSKSSTFLMIFLILVAMICWFKNRMMNALGDYAWMLDTTYDWESNRAFVFSFVVGVMILTAVFWMLLSKDNKQ